MENFRDKRYSAIKYDQDILDCFLKSVQHKIYLKITQRWNQGFIRSVFLCVNVHVTVLSRAAFPSCHPMHHPCDNPLWSKTLVTFCQVPSHIKAVIGGICLCGVHSTKLKWWIRTKLVPIRPIWGLQIEMRETSNWPWVFQIRWREVAVDYPPAVSLTNALEHGYRLYTANSEVTLCTWWNKLQCIVHFTAARRWGGKLPGSKSDPDSNPSWSASVMDYLICSILGCTNQGIQDWCDEGK